MLFKSCLFKSTSSLASSLCSLFPYFCIYCVFETDFCRHCSYCILTWVHSDILRIFYQGRGRKSSEKCILHLKMSRVQCMSESSFIDVDEVFHVLKSSVELASAVYGFPLTFPVKQLRSDSLRCSLVLLPKILYLNLLTAFQPWEEERRSLNIAGAVDINQYRNVHISPHTHTHAHAHAHAHTLATVAPFDVGAELLHSGSPL